MGCGEPIGPPTLGGLRLSGEATDGDGDEKASGGSEKLPLITLPGEDGRNESLDGEQCLTVASAPDRYPTGGSCRWVQSEVAGGFQTRRLPQVATNVLGRDPD